MTAVVRYRHGISFDPMLRTTVALTLYYGLGYAWWHCTVVHERSLEKALRHFDPVARLQADVE